MRKLDKTSLYHAANRPIFKSLNLQPSTVSFRLTDNLRRVYCCKDSVAMMIRSKAQGSSTCPWIGNLQKVLF